MKNTFIYLIGFPGTGKYTIAREICRQAEDFRLVDNHLINNPVFSLIAADGITPLPQQVWDNTEKIWNVVLDTIVNISPADYSFVFTNALLQSNPADRGWLLQLQDMAENKRNGIFVPVRLACAVEELKKRIVNNDRKIRMKTIDPLAPQRYAQHEEVLRVEHKNLLNLDVTHLNPETAATAILNHARRMADSGT